MSRTETKPSTPFANGTEYEVFLSTFCERCNKHKIDERGFCAFVDEGGCPIENAMEDARFGEPFPSDDIVRVYEGGEIICWNACTKFETDDTELMQKYNVFIGRADYEQR